jgi:rhamnogalacturonyl hydrolase YesR
MVPPFLAYYSIVSNDLSYMREAQTQITLYRKLLQARGGTPGRRLWRHIAGRDGPENSDLGLWSTGNAWVAAGLARVLATSRRWGPTKADAVFHAQLIQIVEEIVNGAMAVDDDEKSGLLRNYLKDKSSFGEVSGTALLAATVYRMAVLEPQTFARKYLQWAEKKSNAVVKHVDAKSGIAGPVSSLKTELQQEPLTTGTSEGQSFVVMLYSAQRDYLAWKENS